VPDGGADCIGNSFNAATAGRDKVPHDAGHPRSVHHSDGVLSLTDRPRQDGALPALPCGPAAGVALGCSLRGGDYASSASRSF
jgi:hypothetical protein